jgi:hypothetical protein
MTTLIVYFASSPTTPSSSSSSATTTTTIATVQPSRIIQNSIKPIPIIPLPPSITLPTPASPTQTSPSSRTPSKRNKTFFERFNDSSPSTSTTQSSPNQPQSNDLSNSSTDPPPRLRRRFTFRRSLRQSVHNKGGDIDDGIRSVISFSFVNSSLCRYLFYAPAE